MRFLAVFVLFLLAEAASAQSFYAVRRERNFIVMGGTGTSHYMGDLQDPKRLTQVRYNLLAGVEYYLFPRVSVRVEFTYFRLAGDDAVSNNEGRKLRNLSFFSNNFEISTVGTVNLFPITNRFYQRPIFNAYVFGGAGLLFTNPKTERDNGEKVALQPIETEGVSYSKLQPVLIGGVGVKYMISPFINLALDAGYRISFTDYLDDVSAREYYDNPDADYELTDPLAIELNRRGPVGVRGNPDNNDGYLLINMKVQYYISKELFPQRQNKLYRQKRKSYYKRR